jgi:hypothetical protein
MKSAKAIILELIDRLMADNADEWDYLQEMKERIENS